jgi:tRNA(Ser,Leu) C12 N-acetylase TAN1
MELLVSHPRGRYGKARREILRTLRRLGDGRPVVERTAVHGIALVHTGLDGREVAHRCRELFLEGFAFEHAVKWVPVDYWCEPDLEAMRNLLAEKVCDQIAQNETWGMKVEKRRWQRYSTRDIVVHLAGAIDRRVDLDHPDKLVRVDVVGGQVAVSVLRPGDIFSIAAPEGPAPAPAQRDTHRHQVETGELLAINSPAS